MVTTERPDTRLRWPGRVPFFVFVACCEREGAETGETSLCCYIVLVGILMGKLEDGMIMVGSNWTLGEASSPLVTSN